MKLEAIPRISITETYYSILTFSGVNRPRKIEKNHETSPKMIGGKFQSKMGKSATENVKKGEISKFLGENFLPRKLA